MLKIYVPKDFIIELSYVVKVLLAENLNFTQYEIDSCNDVDIRFVNSSGQIKFANVFFIGDIDSLHTKDNLPSTCIDFLYNGNKYKALYAKNDEIGCDGNCFKIGPDIFATTYFLLTQWESTILEGDHLGRYKLETSSLSKFGIYTTPIVNQYIQLMQQLLQSLNIFTTIDEYKPHFTCDIDSITKYKSLRNLIGGIYHRRELFGIIKSYFQSKNNKKSDPYYSFDYLFGILEKCRIDSTFYFMSGFEDKKYDTMDYDLAEPLIQDIIETIKERKYSIGLHPTINAWKSNEIIANQKLLLEENTKISVSNIRQHYLRYDVNTTWNVMNRNAFLYDSSMQFTEGMGFAAGICTPFTLFDLNSRKETKVKEIPLIVMKKKDYVRDVSVTFDKMNGIINQAKKYNGRFMILFHNSDLETENERILFEKVMQVL